MQATGFGDRLATVMQRLADELGPAATIRRDGTDWTIQPARVTASPLWIAGANAWTLTVGFGRASARIELGHSSTTPRTRRWRSWRPSATR